ncbi:hypothetical protein E2A72_03950 [Salmonella enterica]|nr:hypothetical protein [Salmonella enterica]ECE6699843.1 hypothetical protein [Salmonella enterica subsp. houtenae]EDQ4898802.1 hypothetical protein [Salmonella enterica]EEG5183425.1 hypothetical protein [Salmonella enterica subsp. houtenae]EJK4621604.1 hypothetical protein [Salmonella enterica]
MNGFDANVMKPVLKKVVFIGKAIATIKSKITNPAKTARLSRRLKSGWMVQNFPECPAEKPAISKEKVR